MRQLIERTSEAGPRKARSGGNRKITMALPDILQRLITGPHSRTTASAAANSHVLVHSLLSPQRTGRFRTLPDYFDKSMPGAIPLLGGKLSSLVTTRSGPTQSNAPKGLRTPLDYFFLCLST